MTIIFGNGSIANLNNIHSVEINNDLERAQLVMAIAAYDKMEVTHEDDSHSSGSDGSVPEPNLGS